MRIIDLFSSAKPFISLEFFPPKDKADWPAFYAQTEKLAKLEPLFVSVTYGAGGGTQANSLDIVRHLQGSGLETLAHLTCVGASRDLLENFLEQLAKFGARNVLALRGDRPKDAAQPESASESEFAHACDLAAFIRSAHPEFGLAVAAYPETHPEALSASEDLRYLAKKCRSGGDFAITQLFFDNRLYYDFLRRAREAGIEVPILPGILPVLNLGLLKRITSLCGAGIPGEFLAALEKAEQEGGAAAVRRLGILRARAQARDLLANGAPGVHLYTLNKSEACLEIADGLLPGAG